VSQHGELLHLLVETGLKPVKLQTQDGVKMIKSLDHQETMTGVLNQMKVVELAEVEAEEVLEETMKDRVVLVVVDPILLLVEHASSVVKKVISQENVLIPAKPMQEEVDLVAEVELASSATKRAIWLVNALMQPKTMMVEEEAEEEAVEVSTVVR
jgi:hypothetical protein